MYVGIKCIKWLQVNGIYNFQTYECKDTPCEKFCPPLTVKKPGENIGIDKIFNKCKKMIADTVIASCYSKVIGNSFTY